jgi:hypothetical protein
MPRRRKRDARPQVEYTAAAVRSSGGLCDSSRPPQDLNRFLRFNQHRFFQRRCAKLVLLVHLDAKVDQELNGIGVIFDGQVMQSSFTKARTQLEDLWMIHDELPCEFRIADRQLN